MDVRERLALWLRPLFFLGHNPLTLIGAIVTTSAGLTLVGFWAMEIISGGPTHPYAGIFLFLLLPAVFVSGLVLMPVGVLVRRRKLKVRGELPSIYPQINLAEPVLRNSFLLVGIATVANVAIFGTATYKGVEHMESVQFCGLTCHQVMAPEYTAYVDSPHARVACVQCHIGPGANWFVRSKLSGTRQVFAVTFKTYSRPIPSPVRELRPARETCEQCHWPRRFTGDKLLVRTKYADDEVNTKLTTVLMLRVGGHGGQGGAGIHGRHLDTAERIHYVTTDGKRQVIPRVTYLDDSGKDVVYDSEDAVSAEKLAAGEQRAMDCMDCHNRPTHAYQLPERAVDLALSEGRISSALPFIKKKAVELLRAEYPNRDTAVKRIGDGIDAFYRETYADVYREKRSLVDAAGTAVKTIYQRNVFPEMRVAWGTYPNNIGHEDFPGCFRCHDDKHKSADGRTITQDCSACHAILAMEEENPKILEDLGIQ